MGYLETFKKEYEIDTTEVVIRKRPFSVFLPRDIERFLDKKDIFQDFPLWAKVWESSLVLADYMAELEPSEDIHFLELGAGLGLAGIVAASFGHRITLTEYNRHALDFARANAELNLEEDPSRIRILELDWNSPDLEGRFDTLIGSEIAYKEEAFPMLLELFRRYLKPGGEIILAEGARKSSMDFFRQMSELFDIKAQKKIFRSHEKESKVLFCRMSWKAAP